MLNTHLTRRVDGGETETFGVVSRRGFLRSGVASLFAPSLCGCDFDLLGLGDGDPRLSARPGSPIMQPEIGESSLGLDGGRDGLLYVPESYESGTPLPLFIALHGAGGDADGWAGLYSMAEEHRVIVLVPESRGSTWERVRGDFGADVEFIDRALAHTFERCRIDAKRIALGGFSDGATYALSLGLSNGDLLSHLIAFSPGFISDTDRTVGKPRIFISHGNEDMVLPIANSRLRFVPQLRNRGYDVRYKEFEGGHTVPREIVEMALEWVLA